MQRLGFIHDMMDVKVLILYVACRSSYPMTTQEIYELCYQDDCLSYFDVCTAIPEMVASGHLQKVGEEHYEVTEKGRHDGALTEDSIAFTVKQKAENVVAIGILEQETELQSRSIIEKAETIYKRSLQNEIDVPVRFTSETIPIID